mmetsp:Transcript_43527/g.93754  ORF Transcript_43527/g.93754 Transcript_43527/m.93754 type:complete len:233 (+) Transcript_43527:75-773(+)
MKDPSTPSASRRRPRPLHLVIIGAPKAFAACSSLLLLGLLLPLETSIVAAAAAAASASASAPSSTSSASSYGKPPCPEGTLESSILGRTLCATSCQDGGTPSCPPKPPGSVAEPQCILQVPKESGGTVPGTWAGQKYCGLVCTADSYCPPGSKCTRLEVGQGDAFMKENPLATVSPILVPQDNVLGVCTYKAKKQKKGKEKKGQVLDLSMKLLGLQVLKQHSIQPPPGTTEL